MKFRGIVHFEFLYQARRVRTWVYFAVLFFVAYLLTKNSLNDAREGNVLANSPYSVAVITVICNLLWTLISTPVAGSAAARDVQTRMYPLIYTTPISKADYLGGRFLAAFLLNALVLLAVPLANLIALYLPGAEHDLVGPLRPAAHLSAYGALALPTAFAVTAVQFSLAALNGRAVVSYLGSVFLFVTVSIGAGAVINLLHMPTVGKLLDPLGYVSVIGLSRTLTPIEKNSVLVALGSSLLANRALWVCLALAILLFTHVRFRLDHRAA